MACLVMVADGRFPSGGHAYSGGMEAAVVDGRVQGLEDLRAFLMGRLHTAGAVAAGLAAASCEVGRDQTLRSSGWRLLDAEADARITAPALRAASRRQGRQLLRAGRAAWPGDVLDDFTSAVPDGAHHPVVLGAVASAGGMDPAQAALVGAYDSACGPGLAAVRLLGLDPFEVQSLLAAALPAIEAVAAEAARVCTGRLSDLPALTGPLLDISAEVHANLQARLFAS